MPFEISESWVWCKPSDVFIINPRNSEEDATEVGFVPMPSIMDGYHYQHRFETTLWKNVKTGYTHFANGDFGLAKITPCFENRKSVIFSNLPNKIGAGTTELHILRPITIDVQYIAYFYSSEEFITYGIKNFSGAVGQQRISKEVIDNFGFALPPLAEQKRIVNAVEKWFAIIDKIEREQTDLANVIKQAKSKILDLAIHGKLVPQDPNDEPAIELLRRINPEFKPCDNAHYQYDLPDNWEWTTLGCIGKWQSGGTPDRKNKSYYNGKIPWLKIADLRDDYVTEATEFITQEGLNNSSAKYNPTGSVALAMYGSIGKVGLLTFPATTNQAICVCSKYIIDQKFLFFYLISQRDNFFMKSGGGVQANISKQIIVKHPIPIPPHLEQLRIVAKIEELFATLDKIKESLEV